MVIDMLANACALVAMAMTTLGTAGIIIIACYSGHFWLLAFVPVWFGIWFTLTNRIINWCL